MKVHETALPGVLLIEPRIFRDERGYFLETWREESYREAGLPDLSAQDNLSHSAHGVLRGLHLQSPHPQAKLCQVLEGEVWDVSVDVRRDSPHYGRWVGVMLSAENRHQLFVPAGFAHGFCVTSESALFAYKCSDRYVPEAELAIRWDDADLAIDWRVEEPRVSDKDAAGLRLRDVPRDRLIAYPSSAS